MIVYQGPQWYSMTLHNVSRPSMVFHGPNGVSRPSMALQVVTRVSPLSIALNRVPWTSTTLPPAPCPSPWTGLPSPLTGPAYPRLSRTGWCPSLTQRPRTEDQSTQNLRSTEHQPTLTPHSSKNLVSVNLTLPLNKDLVSVYLTLPSSKDLVTGQWSVSP